MITYSIIQKSQLEGAKRWDAEYYQPEFLELISKIKSRKSKLLSEIGEIVYGTTPEGGNFELSGIPFVRSQNFSNILIDTSEMVFCSEKFNKQNKKSAIIPGDLLFAAVGATIGELAIVQDEIKKGNINQNIARIRITDKNINPYFVGLFFASKLGQLQIERLVTGNAQFYLNSEQVGSFFVPVLSSRQQTEAENFFQEIQKQNNLSKNYYSQAENLLLEELKISEKDFNNQLSCIVNLSNAESANRFDAEYFEPKYQKITEHIKKNFKWSLLGDLAGVKKGFEPGAESYREEGRQFIRVSSLSKYEISESEQKCLSEELYNKLKADYQPQKGEILLTKDASPGIAYVVKEDIEGIISSGILRLKLKNKEIEDEYLALCLNSIIGKMQAERDAGGSVIMHWKPDEIKNVIIPILPKPIQQKISLLIRQSFESRIKAKALLEEAKRKVEEMIEKT